MEPSRFERYLDKLEHARERLALVDAWSGKAEDELHWRLATYKAFQESAEALADLLAMAVVDTGGVPKDDYRNIDLAVERGIIEDRLVDPLAEVTGLRNRLVHEYDTLDDGIALESIVGLSDPMDDTLEEVETWLSTTD